MSIIAREVEFSPGEQPQIYHAVEQADYVSIIAVTPNGKLPVVRQYRPTIEGFSWELPAGLVDPGESPADTCRRELLEETGLWARAIHPLGQNSPCPGRLNNRIHNFFVEAGECIAGFEPEPGLVVTLMSPEDVVVRRFRLSIMYRYVDARRSAWFSGSAKQGCEATHGTRGGLLTAALRVCLISPNWIGAMGGIELQINHCD